MRGAGGGGRQAHHVGLEFRRRAGTREASQRTRDALQLKVQRGYVSGGVVFGYRNVPVLDEGGRRSHVVREIRDDETAIVRRIFEMVASGEFKAL